MKLKLSEVRNFREENGRRSFEAVVLLRSRSVKTAKNGSEFLTLEFGDNSASIPAMCFEGAPSFALLRDAPVGTAFEIAATAEFFNGRLSPKIDSARVLAEDEERAALPSLVPVSKLDPAAMKAEFEEFAAKISDGALRATVLYALGECGGFFTSVAAVKMHHAHMYGLLEHSLKMARAASALETRPASTAARSSASSRRKTRPSGSATTSRNRSSKWESGPLSAVPRVMSK